jgi:hypothetical protein
MLSKTPCKWFLISNGFISEVWDRAQKAMKQEIATMKPQQEQWMGSRQLIKHFRNGLADCSDEARFKIIYGFEQVLP